VRPETECGGSSSDGSSSAAAGGGGGGSSSAGGGSSSGSSTGGCGGSSSAGGCGGSSSRAGGASSRVGGGGSRGSEDDRVRKNTFYLQRIMLNACFCRGVCAGWGQEGPCKALVQSSMHKCWCGLLLHSGLCGPHIDVTDETRGQLCRW